MSTLYEDGKAKWLPWRLAFMIPRTRRSLSGVNADDMGSQHLEPNLYEGADIRLKSDAEAADAAGDGQGAGGRPGR